ncbi:group 1 glycosyl transferase [Coraliomargarita sinensis]|uniref:Group 1 glycosyl transferase n=1 Tax=Coraliomargarita sinensis TaxID=2174842 RepID=A0A317ZFA9_9BACT|nr:group 1 glycosyl transferase [Coraliomargarita sinensis]
MLSAKLDLFSSLHKRETAPFSIFRIYQALDHSVASSIRQSREGELSAVYAFEDGALASFEAAGEKGIKRIYDMPIAYWEAAARLLNEEKERYPEWSVTMPGLTDSQEKLERKTREIELADAVVCPSHFVMDSLPEQIKRTKTCAISHFGCHPDDKWTARKTPENGPLRLLFVGSLTQRKGLADIFEAVRRLNSRQIELVVLGSTVASMEFYRNQGVPFTYKSPRSNEGVLELMSACDIFILPSIVEGRALVQLEALGVGLPLIITPNTGGEDLIADDGSTGFSVPIRSPEAIAEKIDWFLGNRDKIDAMKSASKKRAQMITWPKYQQTLLQVIKTILGEP